MSAIEESPVAAAIRASGVCMVELQATMPARLAGFRAAVGGCSTRKLIDGVSLEEVAALKAGVLSLARNDPAR